MNTGKSTGLFVLPSRPTLLDFIIIIIKIITFIEEPK
jgi:hypothetical protein